MPKFFTICCGIETFTNEEEGFICRKCGKVDAEVVEEGEGIGYMANCFACNRKLGGNPHHVDTRDDQHVAVGSECYKLVKEAGEKGYFSAKCGLRLWEIPEGMWLKERITGGGQNN